MRGFYHKYKYYLRWIVSIGLLVFIFFKIDFDLLVKSFSVVPWWYYLLSSLLFLIMQFVNGYRWGIFLPNYPVVELVKYSFISQSYSFVLPSSLTADFSKIVIADRKSENFTELTTSVICDKIVTFFSLTVLLLVSIFFCSCMEFKKFLFPSIIFTSILCIILTIIYFIEPDVFIEKFFFSFSKNLKFLNSLVNFHRRIKEKMLNFKIVCFSFATGLFVQFLNTITFLLMDKIIGFGLNFFDYLIVSSVLQILLVLPLSIGGIGLRDLSTVAVFSLAGISENKSLIYSLSLYPALLLVVLFGFILDFRKNILK